MGRSRLVLFFAVVSAIIAGAGSAGEHATPDVVVGGDPDEPKVIYGTDDRIDHYQAWTAAQLHVFEATAAVMDASLVYPTSDGGYDIDISVTYGEFANLCPGELYEDQPSPAYCSGFKIGDSLIATAGHCVIDATECAATVFVFGFHMIDAATPVAHVSGENVYACSRIVEQVFNSTEDWAVIEVDRPIVGRAALPLRPAGLVESDSDVQELALCGHPVGIPTKFAANAEVQSTHPHYFDANLDAFGGNSGSPVVSLDSSGELMWAEGVLVRGNPDYVFDGALGCYRPSVCDDTGCTGSQGAGWEEVTRSSLFDHHVGFPGFCGDGICDGFGAGEDCETCPDDCRGKFHPRHGWSRCCGNGICERGENRLKCPVDCN